MAKQLDQIVLANWSECIREWMWIPETLSRISNKRKFME